MNILGFFHQFLQIVFCLDFLKNRLRNEQAQFHNIFTVGIFRIFNTLFYFRKLLESVKRKRDEYSGTPHEGTPMKWRPLHELAMNQRNEIRNEIYQRKYDRNNNEVRSTNRLSEPPVNSISSSAFQSTHSVRISLNFSTTFRF